MSPDPNPIREADAQPVQEKRAEPLQELLADILQRSGSGTPFTAVERQLEQSVRAALVDVARRHQGQPLTADPVGAALVGTVYEVWFRGRMTPPPDWHALATEVAAAMLDDPAARERLARLWNSLQERA